MSAELMTPAGLVPYTVAWTGEDHLPMPLIARPSGIAYADETVIDRDSRGVLWTRRCSLPRTGRPRFGQEHPVRQRTAMRKLLCQVCGTPADRTAQGVLWLLKDHRGDWPGWPDRMANTYPPVCLPCARLSVRLCPALRRGHVAVRARSSISGVFGTRYRAAGALAGVAAVGDEVVAYDDPAIRWTCAAKLIRSLHDSVVLDLDTLR